MLKFFINYSSYLILLLDESMEQGYSTANKREFLEYVVIYFPHVQQCL